MSTAAQILTVKNDLTFFPFQSYHTDRKKLLEQRLVRGVFLRPHSIPQSFSEYMEIVETRGSKSERFPDERATKGLKCPEK